jgi:phage gp36-like protein
MAYATQSDLVPLRMSQKDLVELTDDANTGQVNTQIVSAALEEASGRVDSYCRARYVTPLQQSDTVKSLTLDIAVYLLFSRRRETRIADTVQQRFEQAMSFLKDISTAKASLDQPATAQTPQSSVAGPEPSEKDCHLRFRDRHLEGYV